MKTAFALGIAAVASVSSLSCAASAPPGPQAAPLPGDGAGELVTFRLVDAMISPTRLDGRPWDTATPIEDPGVRERIVATMNHASNAKLAYDAASAALGRLGETWGRPDVGGSASVDPGDGKALTRALEGGKDSLTPRFGAEWAHVPLTHWTTVRMYFVDRDGAGNDDIGAVVLSPLDLAAALKENGAAYHLRVDDQTNGQILFVGISVKAESVRGG